MTVGTRIGVVVLLLVAAVLAGCGVRRPVIRVAPVLRVAPLLSCLRLSGADAGAVGASRDLQVSGGEVSISFSTFNGYIGLADGRRQARSAAQALDVDLRLFQQAGTALLHGEAVYYFDAPIVPAAAGRLVTACLDGSRTGALAALAALSESLPRVELPAATRVSFAARCRAAGCGCAYARAQRLYPPGRVALLGADTIVALLDICSRDHAAVRTRPQKSGTNQRAAPIVPPTARIVVGATA